MGCYVTSFNFAKDAPLTNPIDYDRKFATLYPRQTVSLCMIAKNAANTIRSALDPIAGYVDEVIVAIDETTDDRTKKIIDEFAQDNHLWPVVTTFPIESPLKTGFDEAMRTRAKRSAGATTTRHSTSEASAPASTSVSAPSWSS